MMYSEFIGMIKLVSGEEVIGSVLVCDEENGFIVETRFSIDETIIETPAGEMVKVDLRPWIKFSAEEIIFIEKEKTITVYEADERITKIYNRTLRKYLHQEDNTSQLPLNEEMGFKTKVDEARNSLEKIFKDS